MYDLPSNAVNGEAYLASTLHEDNEKQACFLMTTENDVRVFDDRKVQRDDSSSCGRFVHLKDQPSLPALPNLSPSLKAKNATEKNQTSAGLGLNPTLSIVNDCANKENAAVPALNATGT